MKNYSTYLSLHLAHSDPFCFAELPSYIHVALDWLGSVYHLEAVHIFIGFICVIESHIFKLFKCDLH